MAVRICPRICFCGESISKNAFRWFESVYRPEMMRKARKCIYKISKNFRVEKSGEISRNLRFSCALARFSCLHLNQTLMMAGMAGFEPTDAGVKVPCLTAWRHPNKIPIYCTTVSPFCQYLFFMLSREFPNFFHKLDGNARIPG